MKNNTFEQVNREKKCGITKVFFMVWFHIKFRYLKNTHTTYHKITLWRVLRCAELLEGNSERFFRTQQKSVKMIIVYTLYNAFLIHDRIGSSVRFLPATTIFTSKNIAF